MSYDSKYSKPFRVRISTDCRESPEKRLDGERGWCLGLYEYPYIDRRMPDELLEKEEENAFSDYNPLILTDSREYIWGLDCYWADEAEVEGIPLEVLQDAAALQAYLLRTKIEAGSN